MTTEADLKKECHLREILEQRIDALERLTNERFVALKESIAVAKEGVDQRLEKLNEVRAMLAEWRTTFEPIGRYDALKDRFEVAIDGLADSTNRRIGALEESSNRAVGRSSMQQYAIGIAIILIPLIVGAVAYVVGNVNRGG